MTNSDFQLRHFLVGDSKTADGAYSVMYAQRIDMEVKIKHSDAQRLRREAKIATAEEILALPIEQTTRAARAEAEADIIECLAGTATWELNLQAAVNELKTINGIMAELEPLRKYAHLGILEAGEACQQEEWKLELMARIENNILCQGGVPVEEMRLMRSHPEFLTALVPHMQLWHNNIATGLSLADKLNVAVKGAPMLALASDVPALGLSSVTAINYSAKH